MQTTFVDTDPTANNVRPLAVALLAKTQRLLQPGPTLYETYMISQGLEARPADRFQPLVLTAG